MKQLIQPFLWGHAPQFHAIGGGGLLVRGMNNDDTLHVEI